MDTQKSNISLLESVNLKIWIWDLGFGWDLGSGHAKSLKSWGKSYKDSRFLVLNIPFWVQNNRFKDFYKIVLA